MLPITTITKSYFLKVISHSHVILDLTPACLFKAARIVLELPHAFQTGFMIAEPLPGGCSVDAPKEQHTMAHTNYFLLTRDRFSIIRGGQQLNEPPCDISRQELDDVYVGPRILWIGLMNSMGD